MAGNTEKNEQHEVEDLDPDLDQANPDQPGEGDEDDEVVVQIGDEESPPQEKEDAPQWVKDLRKSHRELQRENRELKAKSATPAKEEPDKLPARPVLADFEFDEDKYQAAYDAWHSKKSEMDTKEARKRQAAEDAQKQVETVKTAHKEKAKALKVKDYEDAEEAVIAATSETQQGLLLNGAANSALLVYALGTNPRKLSELAAIKDPVKFVWAAAQLEKELKVTNRKNEKPAPETVPRSSGGAAVQSGNKTLERLREEAQKTGDMSKVIAFKRAQRK